MSLYGCWCVCPCASTIVVVSVVFAVRADVGVYHSHETSFAVVIVDRRFCLHML